MKDIFETVWNASASAVINAVEPVVRTGVIVAVVVFVFTILSLVLFFEGIEITRERKTK